MFIDTHCHLSYEDYEDIDLVIKKNRENNISKIIVSGCNRESIFECLELVKKYKDVYLTLGYHPSEASITELDSIVELKEIIKNCPRVVGVGEIGLDYHYGVKDREKQKELFMAQMRLAKELQLPVVIHSRDATADTIEILKEFPRVVGDIHCFSGSIETAKIYISMGYMIGIGGVVTFKNSNLFKIVEAIGISNILLETDSPYLTPVPYRGKINSSKYIPIIAERIAEILGISVLEVSSITTSNACRLFDLK